MNRLLRNGPGSLTVLVLGLVAAAGAAADVPTPYVIRDGRKIPGSDVRADRQGNIRLTTPAGVVSFEPGTTVVVDEPAAFPELRRQVNAGRHAEAVNGLREIVEQYRFLGWDNRARRYLARAMVGAGQFADAVRVVENLIAAQPAARAEPAVQDTYLRALHGAGEREKLLPLLDEVIRDGGRQPVALAQVMRGNIRLEMDQPEMALYDFLRTATLFRSVREVQPEALYQAASGLEKMGLREQADAFYRQLTESYPDSAFAQRVRNR